MIIRLASSNFLGFVLTLPVAAAAALTVSLASSPPGWTLAAVLSTVAAALFAGATYHVIRVRRFLRQFPPPGRMIPVAGRPMHLIVAGEPGQGPTVVWLPGSHDAGTELEHLHLQLAGAARSILVDRMGSGWSAPATTPRRIETEVEELAQALDGAGEPGPFILVGHSMGGVLAANFVARHRDRTAGAILLDMGCTDINVYVEHLPGRKTIGAEPWLPVIAAFGLLWHILPRRHPDEFAGTPANERRLGFKAQPKTHAGWISAYRSICADPLAYVRHAGDLGDVPLFVVTPLQDFEADRRMLAPHVPTLSPFRLRNLVYLRFDAMEANARLSTCGELRFAPAGATHAIPYEVPEWVLGLVNEMIARTTRGARSSATPASSDLQVALESSIQRHGVPGATLAVLRDGGIEVAAAGVLNVDTRVEVTADSLFQIGSVTKSLTATLAMMQVEAGRLQLDAPVTEFLGDFMLADADAARRITLRHLLCHTSGIDGDRLDDTGRNADAVENLVAGLRDCAVIHPPGAFFSYSNAGYIVLGRVLEVLEGKPWDQILKDRLLAPLGLTSAVTLAEDAVRHRVATGHEANAAAVPRPVAGGFAPRSNGPSGTTLAMSARDLVRFARFHVEGVSESGERLLSDASLQGMRQMQVGTPLSPRYAGWGLGWMLFHSGDAQVVGHDGGWAGQSACLRLCPTRQFAVALLANGGFPTGVFRDLAGPLLGRYAGFVLPGPPAAGKAADIDVGPYAGRYARFGQSIDLAATDGRLVGTFGGPYVGEQPVAITIELLSRNQGRCTLGSHPEPIGAYFLEIGDDGRPEYLHCTERAFRRVDP